MLTNAAITKAKPGRKPAKLFDQGGLFLLIQPSGARWWRFKYRFNGREKLISLGVYPAVTLAKARELRDDARRLVAAGIDPSQRRQTERQAKIYTFEAIAREWLRKFSSKWAPSTTETKLRRLEMHVFPRIGSRPIRDLTAADLLPVLTRVADAGKSDTAHRVHQLCSEVFRYAVSTQRADGDPTRDLRGALVPANIEHRAAVTDPAKLGQLLRVLDGYDGSIVVKSALRLAPIVFVRPGELRKAEWTEIDLKAAQWTIPAWRMKMRQTLTVPLSRQAVAILRDLERVTGDGKYVFPSGRSSDRPMSDNAVLAAMRRSGIDKEEASGHGFRATARTLLDEVLHVRVDLIEHQLGHAVKDPLGRAYNRTSFLAERTTMMQQWADYLDGLKSSSAAVAK